MEMSRILDPNVRAHPILTESRRTVPRLEPRPATPSMVTITNVYITPTGRARPRFVHQQAAGRIPRQLIINSLDRPIHLTQVNNDPAIITAPQPTATEVHQLPLGVRSVTADSSTRIAAFSSLTTGYFYPSSEPGTCEEPYHSLTETPHGPSHHCTQCPTRISSTPTLASFRFRSLPLPQPTLPDGQTLPPTICSKCRPLTTSKLKVDYPTPFTHPTAPICDTCVALYLAVRAGHLPDPTTMPPLNMPCQCMTKFKYLMEGWVCYQCKLEELRMRTDQKKLDEMRHRGFVGGVPAGAGAGAGGKEAGYLESGYRCKCGNAVRGDEGARRWGRCVCCDRVVDREGEREREERVVEEVEKE